MSPSTTSPDPSTGPLSRLTRFFFRGLITLAPFVLTIFVFGLITNGVKAYLTGPINRAIYWTLEENAIGWSALEQMGVDPYAARYLDPSSLPPKLVDLSKGTGGFAHPEFLAALARERSERESFLRNPRALFVNPDRLRDDVTKRVPGWVGLVLSLILVVWLGWLFGGLVGRRIAARIDQGLNAIPIVRSVYPYTKQLVEFFFAERKVEFDTVVLVPYPSKGLWSLAFVTSNALRTLREHTGQELVSVFIPSSPMPMTGYTVFLDVNTLVPLSISVDEALRITMSGGVLVPPQERVAGDPGTALAAARARAAEEEPSS